MSVPVDEIGSEERSTDFRRANGAPLVKRLDGSGKWDRYSRPSSWGEDLEDESNLVTWKLKRAIEGVAHFDSLAAQIVAAQGDEGELFGLVDVAIEKGRGNRDADMGTALHAISHRAELEPDFKVPPPFDRDIAAYRECLDALGLVSEHIECHICSDTWRGAGTADRIYRSTKDIKLPDGSIAPAGTAFIGDLKTGRRLTYSIRGFHIQLAIYCDGQFYDVNTDERSPLPDGLNMRWGIIVAMPAGSGAAEAHFIDLDLGREGAALVRGVRQWRKHTEVSTLHPIELGGVELPAEAPLPDSFAFGPTDDEVWVDEMLAYAQHRINMCGQTEQGREALRKVWPQDVPPPRVERPSPAGLAIILATLDRVEAALGLPFAAGDPRSEWRKGLKRGAPEGAILLRHSNQPPSVYLDAIQKAATQ